MCCLSENHPQVHCISCTGTISTKPLHQDHYVFLVDTRNGQEAALSVKMYFFQRLPASSLRVSSTLVPALKKVIPPSSVLLLKENAQENRLVNS